MENKKGRRRRGKKIKSNSEGKNNNIIKWKKKCS
jgi:hypothetical protein